MVQLILILSQICQKHDLKQRGYINQRIKKLLSVLKAGDIKERWTSGAMSEIQGCWRGVNGSHSFTSEAPCDPYTHVFGRMEDLLLCWVTLITTKHGLLLLFHMLESGFVWTFRLHSCLCAPADIFSLPGGSLHLLPCPEENPGPRITDGALPSAPTLIIAHSKGGFWWIAALIKRSVKYLRGTKTQ